MKRKTPEESSTPSSEQGATKKPRNQERQLAFAIGSAPWHESGKAARILSCNRTKAGSRSAAKKFIKEIEPGYVKWARDEKNCPDLREAGKALAAVDDLLGGAPCMNTNAVAAGMGATARCVNYITKKKYLARVKVGDRLQVVTETFGVHNKKMEIHRVFHAPMRPVLPLEDKALRVALVISAQAVLESGNVAGLEERVAFPGYKTGWEFGPESPRHLYEAELVAALSKNDHDLLLFLGHYIASTIRVQEIEVSQ